MTMTINLELSPQTQKRLETMASQSGLALEDYVRSLIERTLASQAEPTEKAGTKQLRGRGMLAGVLSSDDFMRRKHEETIREDRPCSARPSE
jgi:hypothetical protein